MQITPIVIDVALVAIAIANVVVAIHLVVVNIAIVMPDVMAHGLGLSAVPAGCPDGAGAHPGFGRIGPGECHDCPREYRGCQHCGLDDPA
jgi:hypothetical protein